MMRSCRAFRALDDRPSPADDKNLLDKSAADFNKTADEPLDPAFDLGSPVPATPVAPATPSAQAPRPMPFVLDDKGNPVQESPMFSPLMFVPKTPRSAPGTPRARARSRSTTRRTTAGEPDRKESAPVQDRRPSDLALPGPQNDVLAKEATEMPRLLSGSDRYLPILILDF